MGPAIAPPETPPLEPPLTGRARRRLLDQLRSNWKEEVVSARLYRRLAATQPEGEPRLLLEEMAGHELRHARYWRHRLDELSGQSAANPSSPPRLRPTLRELFLPFLARTAGLATVLGLIEGGEAKGKFAYIRQAQMLPDAESRAIAGRIIPDERAHQNTAARLRGRGSSRARAAHLGDYLRDLIFGLNDGLMSNFSLIAGVAGAQPARSVVLLAGTAGLIAGMVSMGAGSYLSNKAQREVVAEEVRREAEEIAYAPEEEREELRRIYRLKGFSEAEVEILVRRITADPQRWLDTLITEELGLSPHPGPSPLIDAAFSGGGFGVAALVPLVPFLFASGGGALLAAGVLSLVALFTVGATKTLVTRRSVLRSGMEMVVVGAGAALVTFAVGHLLAAGG